jgi:hypothetical protein
MKHYLYGLTIHSIQGYIFQTNKLKEIAGASELVEQICTSLFAEPIKKNFEELKADPCAIRNAAGNIRYFFNDETLCRTVVREFPKRVLEFAPGIQFSQAVVSTDAIIKASDFDKLEKLLTAQRNIPIRPVDLGYIAINRSRRTGLPSVERKKSNTEDLINDRATEFKRDIIEKFKKEQTISRVNIDFFGKEDSKRNIPDDFETMVSSNPNNPKYGWLAVIHADGNNMGQALQSLNNPDANTLKAFSRAVDFSTKTAAQNAFRATMSENEIENAKTIPFRPIIVGGDDLTVVCRADLAIKFTESYLKEFEKQTEKNFQKANLETLKKGFTACAGIAFVKVSYPFHYAIGLAEKLCSHAKADSKKIDNNRTPSCLMFHKVQDSFIEDFSEIIDRELTAQASHCRFDFGPYYSTASNDKPIISELLKKANILRGKDENAIKSALRQWLTDLHYNKEMAEQRMNRLISIGKPETLNCLGLEINQKGIFDGKSPVYDWLTILSINTNENTNEND